MCNQFVICGQNRSSRSSQSKRKPKLAQFQRSEKSRESRGSSLLQRNFIMYPFLRFCVIRNKLTFLWELLYPIKIPCWGALLGPV